MSHHYVVPAKLFLDHFQGSGHERGGIQTVVTNRSPSTSGYQAVLLEMVPWYFRILLHTLEVGCVRYADGGIANDCPEGVGQY